VIRATSLTKRFGSTTALDAVTFEARRGEVLGFLGPNGAGKTTALRIITGFLAATEGRVEVCGVDVSLQPQRARAKIGYLPESVPLYPEMRVVEYLAYRAALKGLKPRGRAAALDEALAAAGAEAERRQVIGRLSKGYRQRVGLADALLGRPEVLILDEPTDGLDPNQRREVLERIASLGRDRVVVLSTHVLPEVEAVCARVVILDRGRVIAEGAPAALSRADLQLSVLAGGERAALVAALQAIDGVLKVAVRDEGDALRLTVTTERDVRSEVARAVVAIGALYQLRPAALGLGAAFARLTGAEPPRSELEDLP
jgi:ABC-2 type transport system ATP-binding protein